MPNKFEALTSKLFVIFEYALQKIAGLKRRLLQRSDIRDQRLTN